MKAEQDGERLRERTNERGEMDGGGRTLGYVHRDWEIRLTGYLLGGRTMMRSKIEHLLPSRISGITLMLPLFLAFSAVGCSATYIRATVTSNPLDQIAQQAREDWSVERLDDNDLRLRDSWPIHSFFALGYSASYAFLHYNAQASELDMKYYFRTIGLGFLYIPVYIDAEPGFFGGALKPIMNEQVGDILRWGGATVKNRYTVDESDPFP